MDGGGETSSDSLLKHQKNQGHALSRNNGQETAELPCRSTPPKHLLSLAEEHKRTLPTLSISQATIKRPVATRASPQVLPSSLQPGDLPESSWCLVQAPRSRLKVSRQQSVQWE